MNSDSVLRLDWSNVAKRFSLSFDEVFSSNKKAHFDCLPQAYKVIDGARARWCNLLLLDSVIYFLTASDFIFVSRRAFNQQRVLYESIMEEVQLLDKHLHRDVVINRAVVVESKFQMCKLEYPWDDMHNLKHYLQHDPPAKSKQRYMSIIDLLCDNSPLVDNKLEVLYLRVLYKAMSLTNVYQQQMSMGNCPKGANKLDNFKKTGFYKECAAMAADRATSYVKSRSSRHVDRSSPISMSGCNLNGNEDSDEDYEEYPNKRRHSADGYRRKSRRVRVKSNFKSNYCTSDWMMDDEETGHDDDSGGVNSGKYNGKRSPARCVSISGCSSFCGVQEVEEEDHCTTQSTAGCVTEGVMQMMSVEDEDAMDMAECLAPFLKSVDSMDSLELFDDSLDF